MDNLIKALQIFLKYGNPKFPTYCEHDVLWVCDYDPKYFSDEDLQTLESMGFFWDEDDESFKSFKYGSC